MRKKKKRGKRPYRQPLGSKHCAAEALATSIVAIDFWKREKKHLNIGGLDPANVKARDATLSALRDGTHSSLGVLSEECHASAASSAECSCRKICIRCPCETCVASPSRGLFAKKKLNLVLHHYRYEITGPQSTVPCARANCKHCVKYTRRIAQQARAVSGAQAVAIAEDANSSNSDVDVFDDTWSILPPPSSEGAAELPSRCDSPEEVANAYSRYLPAHTGFVVGSKIGDAVSQDGLPSEWTEGASTESINFLIPKLPPAEAQPPMPLPSKAPGSDDTDTASGSMPPLARDDSDDSDAAFSHVLQHDFDPHIAHETLAEHLHSIDQVAFQFMMEQAPPALANRLAVQVAEMRMLLLRSLDQRPAMETDDVAGSRGRTQYTGLRSGAGSRDDGVEGKANREFCKAHLKHLGVGALVVARTVRGVEEKGETLSSKYSGVNEEMGVPMKGLLVRIVELHPDGTCLALRVGGSASKSERGMYLPDASCRQLRFHSKQISADPLGSFIRRFRAILTDLPEAAVWELEDQGVAVDDMLGEIQRLGHAKGYAVGAADSDGGGDDAAW